MVVFCFFPFVSPLTSTVLCSGFTRELSSDFCFDLSQLIIFSRFCHFFIFVMCFSYFLHLFFFLMFSFFLNFQFPRPSLLFFGVFSSLLCSYRLFSSLTFPLHLFFSSCSFDLLFFLCFFSLCLCSNICLLTSQPHPEFMFTQVPSKHLAHELPTPSYSKIFRVHSKRSRISVHART